MNPDVIIAGGGLAGLFNALQLNRAGLKVTLIEKKAYPFHRVCGEYISNEVLPFFDKLGLDVEPLKVSHINRLEVTSVSGKKLAQPLDLGGFGLSRYTFDNFLYQKAQAEGVQFLLNTHINDIHFNNNQFEVVLPGQTLTAPLVIGAFGKRSNLDKQLNRRFFYRRSPYVGIKVHAKIPFPDDLIQLNNYKDGYCGVVKVDDGKWCMCSLVHRDDVRKYGGLDGVQEHIICKNPYLKELFSQAEILMDKPEVINEISFEKKAPVEQHILMSGDTAGMIAPLCGNGMTMAIHSSKLLSETVIQHYWPQQTFSPQQRAALEQDYTRTWNHQFARRLWLGRRLQNLFGTRMAIDMAIGAANLMPGLMPHLIGKTHGKPFA
ncbi:NAD(P)/FAD-dependent oxidoreductase [Mucilaginibacter koreensis]